MTETVSKLVSAYNTYTTNSLRLNSGLKVEDRVCALQVMATNLRIVCSMLDKLWNKIVDSFPDAFLQLDDIAVAADSTLTLTFEVGQRGANYITVTGSPHSVTVPIRYVEAKDIDVARVCNAISAIVLKEELACASQFDVVRGD